MGGVIKSRYGRTVRNVVAVGDDAAAPMGKVGTAQTVSGKDIRSYWYKLDPKE